tara:strand:- start:21654 stop:22580 length:927 start_codon:yes stop_codon:yes gene_type:complete
MSKNIGNGDAVFTTNFSYFATTEVISLVGATPVFVDINEKTFNINPELLEIQINKTLDEGKLKPKAIIAVDLFGQLADYNKIEKIARKYNLFLIEDAAQSFGASQNGKISCSFGDVAATSFFPAKPYGCYGDGGAIFTNSSKLADIFKSIRMHGQGVDKYDNVRIGLNSRLDTIQAVVLLNKLKIFEDEIEKRNYVASYYSESLHKILETPLIERQNISSWAQYSVLVKDKKTRDLVIDFLNKKQIPTAIYYKKIFSKLKIYENNKFDDFKISQDISNRIFSIPMHPYLTRKQMDKIINNIKNYFSND